MLTEILFSRPPAIPATTIGEPQLPTPTAPVTEPSTGDVGNTAATQTAVGTYIPPALSMEQPLEAPIVKIFAIPTKGIKATTGDIAEQVGTVKPVDQLQPIKGQQFLLGDVGGIKPPPATTSTKNDLSLNKSPYYNYFKILLLIFIIIILYRVFK